MLDIDEALLYSEMKLIYDYDLKLEVMYPFNIFFNLFIVCFAREEDIEQVAKVYDIITC